MKKELADSLNRIKEKEVATPQEESIPDITSPEWSEFLMKQLTPQEVAGKEKFPTVSGLRRLARRYLGTIVESYPTVIQAPVLTGAMGVSEGGKRTPMYQPAVVQWTVVIDSYGAFKKFSDVATVYLCNTDFEYALHPAETAATKAESRALRKALNLRSDIAAAEEIAENPLEITSLEEEEELIKPNDKTLLRNLCTRNKVSLTKFLEEQGYAQYAISDNLDDMPRSVAKQLIKKLQE